MTELELVGLLHLTVLFAGFWGAVHLGGKGPKDAPFPTINSVWDK